MLLINVIGMQDFMALLYSMLPEEYDILRERLDPEAFTELMRRIMSLKFKMRSLPKRMRIRTSDRDVLVGKNVIEAASNLVEYIIKCLREYGVQPDLILRGCEKSEE